VWFVLEVNNREIGNEQNDYRIGGPIEHEIRRSANLFGPRRPKYVGESRAYRNNDAKSCLSAIGFMN
jgi:hypothetical protein